MKKILILVVFSVSALGSAQQHFSGINTSQRVGVIHAGINPAELANISSQYEISLLATSINASSNKIRFGDLFSSSNFEDLIFQGSEDANLRFDGEIYGPGVAYKTDKWTFALTTKAYAKLDLVDVDVNLGDAIVDSAIEAIAGSTTINNANNQRLNGTSWGEIGLSAARNIYEDDGHKFSAGATFKLLFPGSYANFGADQFSGTINTSLGNTTLTNAQANLNIAYSGNLGENFTNFSDYSSSLFGKLNGVAADIGLNYQWKDAVGSTYKLNAGLAVRNIGGMKFQSANNSSTNYILSIEGAESLNLNQFQNVDSLEEIETILLTSGYLNKTENTDTDFRVKLPTVFSGYADVKIIPSFYASLYFQQKLNQDDDNKQIITQNVVAITPRYSVKNYEIWSAWASNEISGISGGVGFRAYGFFLGSGTIITNLVSDSKEADVYFGFSFGFP